VQDLAQDFVHDLRSAQEVAGSSPGATLLVGGATEVGIDFADVLSSKLPVFIAIVVMLAAAMLLVVFRSLVISLQVVLMNALSIDAAVRIQFDPSRLHVFDGDGMTVLSAGGAHGVMRLESPSRSVAATAHPAAD